MWINRLISCIIRVLFLVWISMVVVQWKYLCAVYFDEKVMEKHFDGFHSIYKIIVNTYVVTFYFIGFDFLFLFFILNLHFIRLVWPFVFCYLIDQNSSFCFCFCLMKIRSHLVKGKMFSLCFIIIFFN